MPISINGTGTITGISAGGLPSGIVTGDTISNGSISTVDIADGSITAQKLGYQNFNFRNRIINGDMRIWQRGTTISDPTSVSNFYTADRWGCNRGGDATGAVVSRIASGLTGFEYALAMQRANGNTSTAAPSLWYSNESTNTYDLAGNQVTLSFWAKAGTTLSSSGSQMYVAIVSGTGTDQRIYSYTGAVAFSVTYQTITTSWVRYSFTGTVPSNATELGFQISFTPTGTAGADDSIKITGVQLEAGSTATDFERRPIGTETMLCQRYCWRMSSASTTKIFFQGYMHNTGQLEGVVPFPVPMRTQPTLTSSPASQFSLRTTGNVITALYLYATGGEFEPYTGALLYVSNPTTGNSVGFGQSLISNSSTATFIQFNAEL